MRLQIHIDEKILTILVPWSDRDQEHGHLTEPVFENQGLVDWLAKNEINPVITIESETNMVDLQLGSDENDEKFLEFIETGYKDDIPVWGKIEEGKDI